MKEKLIQLNACEEAREWAGNKSWEEIYNTCERGDWLLWLFVRTNPNDLQLLTLVKGHCANTVRHLMKDEKSIKAVDTAIAFGEGRATREELNDAADAAYGAVAAAYAAYGVVAAYGAVAAVAAGAAGAADVASGAAYVASGAAYAAAYGAAAYGAAGDVAKKENQKLTADICRKYLPIEIWNI